jgi:hypothetical protein
VVQFLAEAKDSSIQTVRTGSMTEMDAYRLVTDIYLHEDNAAGV